MATNGASTISNSNNIYYKRISRIFKTLDEQCSIVVYSEG